MRLIESIRFIGFLELETEEHEAKGCLTPASSRCAGQLTLRVELKSNPVYLDKMFNLFKFWITRYYNGIFPYGGCHCKTVCE